MYLIIDSKVFGVTFGDNFLFAIGIESFMIANMWLDNAN